jgi:hypothetical protein
MKTYGGTEIQLHSFLNSTFLKKNQIPWLCRESNPYSSAVQPVVAYRYTDSTTPAVFFFLEGKKEQTE